MDRRRFLVTSTVAGAALAAGGCATVPPGPIVAAVDSGIDELQRRTFDWFVHVTDRATGLTPHRWPTPSFCSIAAVGFALTGWPTGIERGWMTRDEARARTLMTLRFFHDGPQGPEPTGTIGHGGFFYRFLDMETGRRFGHAGISTEDTALLLGGMLFAARYFDADDRHEAEIRRLAQAVYDRVEWNRAVFGPHRIGMDRGPETGLIAVERSSESDDTLVRLLAIGSRTHPVPPSVWDDGCAVGDRAGSGACGPEHPRFLPPSGYRHSHPFVDFRGVRDTFLRARSAEGGGSDYFEHGVRAVEAQRNHAVANPGGWDGYSADIWGLATCDGPGDFTQVIDARQREFFSRAARAPGQRDDGTIAPTVAMAAYPFAPNAVTACLKAIKSRYGEAVYADFGFLAAFNPTLTEREGRLRHGRIVPGLGWVAGDVLGTDQGPILAMIENGRSDLIWRVMRGEPNLRRGLRRAGFTGGWLDA